MHMQCMWLSIESEAWSYILLAASPYLFFGLVIKQLSVIYDN